jgi:poly(3-hydroxybutyrate) depolymerase
MSNGALFCYVLMAKMPDTFAAFAPVCGASQLMEKIDTPRPMMFIFGAKDTNMPISWGLWVLQYAKKLNGCGDNKSEWIPGYFLYTPNKAGYKLIWRVHPDGHIWPNDATENIVRFFKGEKLADDEVVD